MPNQIDEEIERRICAFNLCQAEFIPNTSNQKYCSYQCANRADYRQKRARDEVGMRERHRANEQRRNGLKKPIQAEGKYLQGIVSKIAGADLPRGSLMVAMQSELAQVWRETLKGGCGCSFTSPLLAQALKGYYKRFRIYRPAMIVWDKLALMGELRTPWLLSATIHALGHILASRRSPLELMKTPRIKPADLPAHLVKIKESACYACAHDTRWIRAELHCWHRAQKITGLEIPLLPTDGIDWQIAKTAFAEELEIFESQPVSLILDLPLPQGTEAIFNQHGAGVDLS